MNVSTEIDAFVAVFGIVFCEPIYDITKNKEKDSTFLSKYSNMTIVFLHEE